MGRVGSMHLGKAEAERFRSIMEPTGKHFRSTGDLV